MVVRLSRSASSTKKSIQPKLPRKKELAQFEAAQRKLLLAEGKSEAPAPQSVRNASRCWRAVAATQHSGRDRHQSFLFRRLRGFGAALDATVKGQGGRRETAFLVDEYSSRWLRPYQSKCRAGQKFLRKTCQARKGSVSLRAPVPVHSQNLRKILPKTRHSMARHLPVYRL